MCEHSCHRIIYLLGMLSSKNRALAVDGHSFHDQLSSASVLTNRWVDVWLTIG